MSLDHEAVRKAYPDAVIIDDGTGAFDKDGKSITLVQSAINTARKELDDAAAAIAYKAIRKGQYPEIGDQLDDLYKQGAFSADMAAKIKKVKDDNPKPS
tara:strand:- start:255 stop:551 length:297 start_codon:yes stop_codon:yes gene_type:complete